MIGFKHKGNFSKTDEMLKTLKGSDLEILLEKYGKMGVDALSAATPVDTGITADSWYYRIVETKTQGVALRFYNSNNQNGVSIVILLQYGHGTRNGGFVVGRDFINPAIQPIFDKLAKEAWGEVTRYKV